MSVLTTLALIFSELSLLAFGGGNTILPEMKRQVVDVHGWLSAPEFGALYALAQAAPGPNMMVVTLVGWRVAGWWGVAVASAATFGPSSLLTGVVVGLWHRFRDRPWRRRLQAGLRPVTVGLVAASAAVITLGADRDLGLAAVTAGGAALSLTGRVHPLLVLAGGAAAGLAGI